MCLHRMDGKRFSLYHELHDDPFEKTQKKPHGSFEVIRWAASMTLIESPKRPL